MSAPLEEPFIPEHVSLARLGTRGLQVDTLQGICRREYVRWQHRRLEIILNFLAELGPGPDLVLFPEGSIPIDSLPLIGEWSAATGANVMAGSHTPRLTGEAKAIYRKLGVRDRRFTQLREGSNRQVLPVLRSGKLTLVRKRLLSPFEQPTIPERPEPTSPIDPLTIQVGGASLDVLPLICSEALQAPNIGGRPEVIALISYDAKPNQFTPFCAQQVNNRRVVAYCNDGRYGGSDILAVTDDRMPDWYRDAFHTVCRQVTP